MKFEEELRTATHYHELLTKYGSSYRALDWGSEEGQLLRFSILAEVGDLSGCSILDVGCGLGDLAGWIGDQGIDVEYVGLDLTESLIKKARLKYPERRFVHGSITDEMVLANEKFDYVIASGIFATYVLEGRSWMELSVSRMWNFARLGIAFNSLSNWAPDTEDGEHYADPLKVLEFAHSLTSWVRMRHDYHPRDFTIFLYKDLR